MADKVLRMVLGILVGAWVARYLGPNQFGTLAYAIAFVAFFQAVATLGLDNIAVRDMARDPNAAPSILGTTLRLRLLIGFACWAAAIAGMVLLRPGDSQALLLVAVIAGSALFQSADTVDLWFLSRTQSKRTVLAKSSALLLASGARIGLILIHAPLVTFAAVMLVEAAITAFALTWAYRGYRTHAPWVWKTQRARHLLQEAWPYLLSGVAILFYMRVDQIMIREMVGEHELGIYTAALPLSTAWYFIPMAICASVAPALARKKARSEAEYMTALSRLFSLMWWYSLPLSVLIALASTPLVGLLYGPAYAASATVLAIHVFGNVPVGLGVAQSQWIANEKRGVLAFYKTTVGALANVCLNLYMIPKYGALGAAIATLISFSISAVFSNILLAPRIFSKQLISLVRYA